MGFGTGAVIFQRPGLSSKQRSYSCLATVRIPGAAVALFWNVLSFVDVVQVGAQSLGPYFAEDRFEFKLSAFIRVQHVE